MSTEDPRISASGRELNGDEGQGIEQIGVGAEHFDEIVVAQNDGEPVPLTDSSEPSAPDQSQIPSQVTADADNVVRLPAGVSIESLRVDGADIVLVQPDGTEIRILNAALNIPTFVIDNIEVPREVLVAVLETNGINVAAGPEGTLSVVGPAPQGSGVEFQDQGSNGDGNDLPGVLSLLAGTEFGEGGQSSENTLDGGDTAPAFVTGIGLGSVTESADVVGGTDADPLPVSGSLAFFDPDFGETRTASITARSVGAENLNNGLTLTAAQIDALLAGLSLDTAGGITTEPSASGNGAVNWTFALGNGAVDFLAAGESVVLSFQITIVDGPQSSVATVNITVFGTNDAPVFSLTGSDAADISLTESISNPLTTTGTLTYSDVDISDNAHSVSGVSVSASGETAQLAASNTAMLGFFNAAVASQTGATGTTGSVGWEFSASDANFDYLREGQELVLTYTVTLTDDAGATVNQDVIVRITGTNDLPVLATATSTAVDEELLTDGNNGDSYAVGDLDPNGALVSGGSLNITWGPDDYTDSSHTTVDGDVVFTNVVNSSAGLPLESRGEEVLFNLSADGATLTGYVPAAVPDPSDPLAGARIVFIATVDEQGSGTYTFELVDVLDHPVSGSEDNIVLTFNVSVIDSDSASQSHAFDISINDDAPVINAAAVLPADTLSVDETALATNATAGFADNFAPAIDYGADGAGSTVYSLVLSAANTASGLYAVDATDTSATGADGDGIGQGDPIVLNIAGDVITGSAGGTDYFTITIDPATGDVTFDQLAAIWHADTADANDASTLATAAASNVQVVATVTDADGDAVSQAIDIGQGVFSVNDDAPVINAAAVLPADTLSVDETALATNATAGFADNFAPAIDYGADGAGSTVYSLVLSAANTASGLYAVDATDTSATGADGDGIGQGDPIVLNIAGDVITGSAGGTDYFTITIDPATGDVTFEQLAAIWHADTADANDASTLATAAASNVQVVATVTDADGDAVSQAIDIGQGVFSVNDDAPVINAAKTNTVDEGDISNLQSRGTTPGDGTADGSSSELFAIGLGYAATVHDSLAGVVSFGADGAPTTGRFGFITDTAAEAAMSALGLTSKGEGLTFNVVGNTLQAYIDNGGSSDFQPLQDRAIFLLELNPDTGDFTFRLFDQLDHVDDGTNNKNTQLQSGSGSLDAIDFGAIIKATDADGDAVVLTGKFLMTVTDDAPVISIATDAAVRIDESGGGDNDNLTGLAIIPAALVFAGVAEPGSDSNLGGPIYAFDANVVDASVAGGADDASISLTFQIDNADSGLTTTSGDAIYLFLENGQVIGRVNDAFGDAAFALNLGSGGGVAIVQYMSLHHPDGGDADDRINLSGKLSAVLRVEDGDGDIALQSVQIGDRIAFDDDGPVTTGNGRTVETLDEDDIAAIAGQPAGTDGSDSVLILGTIGKLDLGADGLGQTLFEGVTFAGTGVSATVADFVTTGIDTGLTSDGEPVFIWLASPTAMIAYTVSGTVFTVALGGSDLGYTIELVRNIDHVYGSSTDRGDRQVIDFSIRVEDGDGDPTFPVLRVRVDDDVPVAISDSATTDEDTVVVGSVGGNDMPGADGVAATYPYNLISVPANGGLAFNAQTGSYSYTPLADWSGTDSFTYTVTDGDGDVSAPVTVTLTVNPVNDAPVVAAIDAGTVSEEDAVQVIDLLAGQTDIDGGALSAISIVVTDNLGDPVAFTDNGDGTISIDPDQYDALDAGDSRTITVNYAVFDGTDSTPNTATLVVDGFTDNVDPETYDVLAIGAEDAASIAVALTGSDADGNLDGFVVKGLPANGTLYLDAGLSNPVAVDTLIAGSSPLTVYFVPDGDWSGATDFTYAAHDDAGLADSTPATATIDVSPVADGVSLTVGNQPLEIVNVSDSDASGDPADNNFYDAPPSVTGLADGGYVVTWYGYRDGDSDVVSRIYDADGSVRVGTVDVSDSDASGDPADNNFYDYDPSVTALADGGYVVTWHGYHDGDYDVFSRVYDADGSVRVGEVDVSDSDASGTSADNNYDDLIPSVTALADGGYVVTWYGYHDGDSDVFSRIYDADGSVRAGEVDVSDSDASGTPADNNDEDSYPSVTGLADGGYVVTWEGYHDGDYDVFSRIYDADGSVRVGEVDVSDSDASGTSADNNYDDLIPSVTALADGGYVVTWYGYHDGDSDIFSRIYDADGSVRAGAVNVSDSDASGDPADNNFYDASPSVTALADGGYVVTWYGFHDGDYDVFSRVYRGIGGSEDSPVSIPVSYVLGDTDGSEAVTSVALSGFPAGATFSAGHADGATWVIDDATEIANLNSTPLTMTPPANYNGGFTLSVTANVTDSAVLSTGAASDSTSTTSTIGITIIPVNDAPVVDLNGANGGGIDFAAGFAEGDTPVLIGDLDLTATDVDSAQLASATVTITNIADGAAETLFFDTSGTAITGSYAAGVLTLTGADTLANYQQVLRTVAYSNSSGAPTDGDRIITVVANDGTLDSAVATSTMTVTGVNDAPVGNNDSLIVDEGGTTTVLDGGSASVLANDTDAENDTLTATLVSDVAHGTLTFNSDGTFSYVHDGSENFTDSFTYVAHDGVGDSNTTIVNITVNPVNDVPVVDLNGANGGGIDFAAGFTEGDTPVLIGDLDLTATDVDSAELASATVTITNIADGAAETLFFDTSGTAITGSYAAGVLTLTGADTLANYQQVLRTVAYSNSSGTPTDGDRIITVVVNDGTLDSAVATSTMTVTGVNYPPVISGEPDLVKVVAGLDPLDLHLIAPTDADGDALSVTITALPGYGGVFEFFNGADWMNVSAGDPPITADQFASLRYTPPEGGDHAGGKIEYTVSDGIAAPVAGSIDVEVLNQGMLYFAANEASGGGNTRELQQYDPGAVDPITPFDGVSKIWSNNTDPTWMTEHDGKIYFAANGGTGNGNELYYYDPTTPAVAPQLIDVRGGTNSSQSSDPQYLTEMDGKLYFAANGSGTNGSARELYVLNGNTPEKIGPDDINPTSITEYDGKLYFSADLGGIGRELYMYDPANPSAGTSGIQFVADLNSGGGGSHSTPSYLTVVGDKLYFAADNKLWVYDDATGTATKIGANGINPTWLAAFQGKLYFSADLGGSIGRELYAYDPATAPVGNNNDVALIANLNGGNGDNGNPSYLTVVQDILFFAANGEGANNTENELYMYGGTGSPILAVPNTNISPTELTEFAGRLYFAAIQTQHNYGNEIYQLDPADLRDTNGNLATGSGGVLAPLADVYPGNDNSSNPQYLAGWGEDKIIDGTPGYDILVGGFGNDTLNGLGGDDLLIGGDGDDILFGGSGQNTLTGGDGADTFVIDPSALTEIGMIDVISDYSLVEGDAIDLGSLLDAAFATPPADDAAVQAAVKLQADGSGGQDLIVNGVDAGGDVVVAHLYGTHAVVNILYDNGDEVQVTV